MVDVEASCDSSCTTVTIDPYPSDPSRLLAANTKYKVVITPGVEYKAGNPLDQNLSKPGNQDKVWTFTTGSS